MRVHPDAADGGRHIAPEVSAGDIKRKAIDVQRRRFARPLGPARDVNPAALNVAIGFRAGDMMTVLQPWPHDREAFVTRYVRYRREGIVRYGILDGETITPLAGDFLDIRFTHLPPVSLDSVELLAPVTPSKIVAVGSNFRGAGEEPGTVLISDMKFWTKPSSVLNDPEGIIELPAHLPSVNVYHEVELGVVIGKRARHVKAGDAHRHIFGYTCVNDLTAGNFAATAVPEASPFFIYGKNFDGFAPIGPCIVTDVDASDLHLECRVNGEIRQSASTSGYRFGPAEIIELISSVMTLYPGDIISMGTPPGVGILADGDIVEVEVEKIGMVRNAVRNALTAAVSGEADVPAALDEWLR